MWLKSVILFILEMLKLVIYIIGILIKHCKHFIICFPDPETTEEVSCHQPIPPTQKKTVFTFVRFTVSLFSEGVLSCCFSVSSLAMGFTIFFNLFDFREKKY